MNPLISIIIPVKNSEEYIIKMLNSIQNQTYDNIEIVIAYDVCSTDRGLQLIENFESKFPLKIIKGKDDSIGSARNRGYEASTGEFIWFCDGDDELFPTSCSDLIEPMLKDSAINISCGNWYMCYSQNEKTVSAKYKKYIGKNKKRNRVEYMNHIDAMHNLWVKRNLSIAAWTYMIRRNYIDLFNLRFPNYSRGEDQIFILKCFKNTDVIAKTTRFVYFYKIHDSSISHEYRGAEKFWVDHKPYRCDYFKIIGNDYPSAEIVAYGDYLRWFVYELAGLTKKEYYDYLQKYGIKVFPIIPKGKLTHVGASILFDIHPELCRMFARLYRKIKGDPLC